MARGRPRKPTELKVLQGCPGGHLSERFNPDEPIPNGPLGIPAQALRLTPLVQEQWDYLVSIIAPGVAMCCDAPLMALTARLMARMADETITDSQMATLLRCLSQLGMTPADRSRIVAQHTKTTRGKFDKFKP